MFNSTQEKIIIAAICGLVFILFLIGCCCCCCWRCRQHLLTGEHDDLTAVEFTQSPTSPEQLGSPQQTGQQPNSNPLRKEQVSDDWPSDDQLSGDEPDGHRLSNDQLSQIRKVNDRFWYEDERAAQLNSKRRSRFAKKTIDLHSYNVGLAMKAVIEFLSEMEEVYHMNKYRRSDRFVYIITGRGRHSPGGIPRIKPAVQGYLEKHDFTHKWDKAGGMVTVDFLSKRRK